MTHAIRTQIWRIAAVYCLIAGIVAWQWAFVWTSIATNTYLNGLILAVFVFGSARMVALVLGLRNEQAAFTALQEVWADIETNRTQPDLDPLWRHERCFEPSSVYRRPRLLGHIFDLALEELHKHKSMRISVSTMQNLVHAIDGRIALERSLISYLGGLSIFLGLIGTFIGLMKMVGSVGGIIGNAAMTGGTDPAAAVQNLMKSLEAPLQGMALGFSASLFGLFGSLVLGLVGKFANQAMGSIRDEFEAWLASISEIESQADGGPVRAGASSSFSAGQLGGLAVSLMSGFRRANETFETAADSIRQLGRQQAQQAELLSRAVTQIERFAEQENEVKDALARTAALRADLAQAREDLRRLEQSMQSGIADGFGAVARKLDGDSSATLAMLLKITTQQDEALQRAAALDVAIEGASTRLAGAIEGTSARLEGAIEGSTMRLAGAVDALRREHGEAVRAAEERSDAFRAMMAGIEALSRNTAATATAAEAAASARLEEISGLLGRTTETSAAVQALVEYAVRQPEGLASALRPALAEGFGGIARALDDTTQTFREGLRALAQQQADLASTLDAAGPARALAQELRQVANAIEVGMTTGFTDLSRAVEGIFLSYAEIARRSEGPASEAAQTAQAAARAVAGAPQRLPEAPVPESEVRDRLRLMAEARRPVPRRHL